MPTRSTKGLCWAASRSCGRSQRRIRARTAMDSAPSPLSPREVVDEYFIENRTRLLEIAAFLDRLDRVDASYAGNDFRMRAFNEALTAIAQGDGRLERIQ